MIYNTLEDLNSKYFMGKDNTKFELPKPSNNNLV